MENCLELYNFIKNNYANYKQICHNEKEILITFHKDFVMRIHLQGFYKIYFNNIFYYDVDIQDIKDTIDDFLTNEYAFCELNKHLKIISFSKFQDNPKFIHVWTREKTIK